MRNIGYTGIRSQVEILISATIEKVQLSLGFSGNLGILKHGKLLRTGLGERLAESGGYRGDPGVLAHACAATELVHTASLCHDDVIDSGEMRRGMETLWKVITPSAAVLIGDMLFCEALEMLQRTAGGRYLASFIARIREVCITEIEQELLLRGKPLDDFTCMRIARQKTGPLFAFIGQVSGAEDPALAGALEESGYRIGTAYQLADDLLDRIGDERLCGKTLGTDALRGKYTLPQSPVNAGAIQEKVAELCRSALECIERWPEARAGVEQFLAYDLKATFDRIHMEMDFSSSNYQNEEHETVRNPTDA